MDAKDTEGGESNDPEDDELENDDTEGINDKNGSEMTPGEESDDEAEEDLSSNKDEGGSETGVNEEEEVFIISFPTSRKRAYSVCLYVSSPTRTSKKFLPKQAHTNQKSRIPRPTKLTGIGTIYSNKLYSHLVRPVIVRTPPSQTLKPQYNQPSRIPRPIASFHLRHAKNI